MGRVALFAVFLVFAMWYLFKAIGQLNFVTNSSPEQIEEWEYSLSDLSQKSDCQRINHDYFTLCYNENKEQALWVAHRLTRHQLNQERVPRHDYFSEDPLVSSKSAHHRDYIRSGYTRGHLVPAADMDHDPVAMEKSFYMSNISPQLRAFNGGIWRELEELCRDWARRHQSLYILSGPIFGRRPVFIGKTSQVAVPKAFFKAIMNDDYESVAFILPNKLSVEPVWNYAVPIDSLESLLGWGIFDKMTEDAYQEEAEGSIDPKFWPVDEKKFEWRVTEWNNR